MKRVNLRKVKTLDPLVIPAATFNTFVDAARDYQQRQRGIQQHAGAAFRQSGIVAVKNASGSDRGRFDVLGIDSPIFTPTENEDAYKNKVTLTGVTPSIAAHLSKFVILLEPIRSGEIGLACAHGVCPAKVYVVTDNHTRADVANGQAGYLSSRVAGSALILWREEGTGEKWAIVSFGSPAKHTWTAVTCSSTGEYTWNLPSNYVATDSGYAYGHYINEVNPTTMQPFSPSRTQDASGTYIPTVARNVAVPHLTAWCPSYQHFIPLAPGSIVEVWWGKTNEGGGYPEWMWLFNSTPTTFPAEIVSVTSSSDFQCKWLNQAMNTFRVLHPAVPRSGEILYPVAQPGDTIIVGRRMPHGITGGPGMFDMTPRIPVKSGSWEEGGGDSWSVQVEVDDALDTHGRLHTLETDT